MALLLGSLLLLAQPWPGAASSGAGFQGCAGLPVLGVLPGGGWDNLRNVELGQVLRRSYEQCRVTEDREYLIPDQVHVVPLRESSLETHSELIEDWLSYTDAFSLSINSEASFLAVLNGKFSLECQLTKSHAVHDETVTTRVQARLHVYSVAARPPWGLEEAFRRQLLDIAGHLQQGRGRQARYLAQLLVLAYGTHVLTEAEAGASLLQEDQVRRALLEDKAARKLDITASASAVFFSRVQLGVNGSGRAWSQQDWAYLRNTVTSRIRSRGGEPFYPGITLERWQRSIPNRLVAVGRAGLPLPFFITPEALPELPVPWVRRLALTVQDAIRQYYAVNTYPGCLKPQAPNFNFQANVDDGSCQVARDNFTFGGAFQECQPASGRDAKELCQAHRTQNPLTGAASCPANYTAVLLKTEERSSSVPKVECLEQCSTCYWLFRCCKNVCGTHYYPNVVRLGAYWCAPSRKPVLPKSGLLFGGLYTSTQGNPLTKTQACPKYFYPLVLLQDLKVCVSSDYEMGAKAALPFGGFFSCQVGNPLAGFALRQNPGILKEFFYQDSATDYPLKCPSGYSQHQAHLSEGCQILYCLEAGTLFAQQLAPIHLPPFLQPPMLNESNLTTATEDSLDGPGLVRLKGTKGFWQLNDASKEADVSGNRSSRFSRETIAGVSLTMAVALVMISGYVIWRFAKRRNYVELPGHLSSEQESAREEIQISLA